MRTVGGIRIPPAVLSFEALCIFELICPIFAIRNLAEMKMNFIEIVVAFMVIFALIDILGSIPLILEIKNKNGEFHSARVTFVAFLIMMAFLLAGEPLPGIFKVDISSFAIAGSFILLFLALEMILGIEFFKQDAPGGGLIVPIAFPLVAGAGFITSLLSLKAEYATINISIALVTNMIIVYIVLRSTRPVEKILGQTGLHILKKVFRYLPPGHSHQVVYHQYRY